MPIERTSIILVQSITAFRAAAALLFASIALQPALRPFAVATYGAALLSDALDGALARRLRVTSQFGGAFDGFADKAITTVSVLYAMTHGAPIVACSLVLLRDLLVLSLRAIRTDAAQLLPPSRAVGALSGLTMRLLTLYLLCETAHGVIVAHVATWFAAVVSISLVSRDIWRGRSEILSAVFQIRGETKERR